MTLLPPRLPSVLAALLACALGASAAEPSVEELYKRLNEGGDVAKQAAFQLFRRGDQDQRLRNLLRNAEGKTKPGSRLCILESLTYGALAQGDPTRPRAARELAFEALDDPEQEVARRAVRVFVNIEDEDTYSFIARRLRRLRFASLESGPGQRALGLVQALERMRNPQRATEVLARLLTERLGPQLESLVLDTLERMTAQRFRTPEQWVNWTERTRTLTLDEWRRDVAARRTTRFRNYEDAAEDWFKALLAAVANDHEQLLDTLRRGLEQTTILSVRKRAVLELARLGRVEGGAEGPLRERAVALLRSQLPKPEEAAVSFDEIQSLVIQKLGSTGDPALLEEIARFLDARSSRLRAAAARALGALKAPAAADPLLAELLQERTAQDRDLSVVGELVEALGRIGRSRTLAGERVSSTLVAIAREAQAAGSDDPHPSLVVTRTAEALGRLSYADESDLDEAVGFLTELAEAADPKIRFAAATALGSLQHPNCFKVLASRLGREPELYVRRAVLDAVGLQAVLVPEVANEAISLLAPYLFDLSDTGGMRRRSFDALRRLTRNGADLPLLDRLVRAVLQNRERASALAVLLPFLRELPEPDSLGEEASAADRERLLGLIELRGWALLPQEPRAALADFEAVLAGRGENATGLAAAPLYLGKGRAKLALELPAEAFAFARAAIEAAGEEPPERLLVDSWTLALDAVEASSKMQPGKAEELFAQLGPLAEGLPESLRERYRALDEEFKKTKASK